MRKSYVSVTFLVIFSLFMFFVGHSVLLADSVGNYSWVLKSMSQVENNSSLVHFEWEICRPPYGPYDTVTLHRVVSYSRVIPFTRDNKKVIFMIPGTWNAGGWSKVTDPNANTMFYLANNGYDVYTMDFRSCNIPDMDYDQFSGNGIDITPSTDWTYAVYREDIKTCVDKIKSESRAKKVFMSGFSRGGIHMYIYASKYQADIRGMIVFDYLVKDFPPMGDQMDEATYNQLVNLFKAGVLPDPDNPGQTIPWIYGVFGLDNQGYNNWKLAGVLPYSRYMVGGALPSNFTVLSDYVADSAHHVWDILGLGEGALTNYYGGYIDRDVLVKALNEFSRYYPARQNLEDMLMQAYANVPYFDYDDNPIDLPMVAYLTSYIGCMMNNCLNDALPNMTTHDDVTINLLAGYGHMDILFGKNSLTDVKQPLLEWLNARAQTASDSAVPATSPSQDEVGAYLESILKTFFHIN